MPYFHLSRASLFALLVLTAAGCAEPSDTVADPDDGGSGASTTGSNHSTTSPTPSTTSVPTTGGASSTTGMAMATTASSVSTMGSSSDGSVGIGTTGAGELDAGPPPMLTEDPFAGLFGDGGPLGGDEPNADAGFTPPPEGEGVWKLNPDSASECPEEPPPIPIIGGACLGIYYACGWTSDQGSVYSCVCDWVHWLCI